MNPVRNSMRFLRRNAVFIVLALLIALVYTQRKSFKKAMGGGGDTIDPKACEGLCGDVISAVPEGGAIFYKDGSVETAEGKFDKCSDQFKAACKLGESPAAAADSDTASTRRRR